MFQPFTLNIRGRIVQCLHPQVMGVVNVTPDSFYAASRTFDAEAVRVRVGEMLAQGVDIIDIGGCSTRPGADSVSAAEETDRVCRGIEAVREVSSDIIISVDTFRADVAAEAYATGADIINDVSGGTLDADMFATVVRLQCPYILMHMRGTPDTMQTLTDYEDVTAEVTQWLAERLRELRLMGVADVIVDPGFGFAKTLEQNYTLLRNLRVIGESLGVPLLAGMSRKSMVTRLLGVSADDAGAGTVAVNTIALLNGASILRVHDVKAAVEARRIVEAYYNKS